MARLLFIGTLSTLTLTLALGCSDDESSGPSIDALPSVLAEAACTAVSDCLGPASDLFFESEDCVTSVGRGIQDLVDAIEPSLQAGRVDYEGRKVEGCVDAVRAAGCEFPGALEGAECRAALDGTVALGDDCDFSLECEGNAYCKSTGTCPGVCTEGEPDGGPCTSDSDCARGLECNETLGECFLPGGSGDRCEGGVAPECELGLSCIGADENLARAGTCRLLSEVLSAATGAACNPIEGPMCASGLPCRIDALPPALSATCVAKVGRGAACGLAFPDMCPAEQYCAIPADQLAGTCTDRPAAGAACAAGPLGDAANICAPDTRCDGGICRPRQEVGGSCAANDVCLSEHCVGGKCALDGACE